MTRQGHSKRPTLPGSVDVVDMQRIAHAEAHDYEFGSPHLHHRELKERLVTTVRLALQTAMANGLPPLVLEVGAGAGGYTEPVLASGYEVTATEVSPSSISRLEDRYGTNPRFSPVLDPDGSLRILGEQRFSAMLCVSVLHHIPDYVQFLTDALSTHLIPGGTFICLQDPLSHPSLDRKTRWFSAASFLWWRIPKGNYITGVRNRLRRYRGRYDDANPADSVEYHAVREGVDQKAILNLLNSRFERVELITYWSTQSSLCQSLGEALKFRNTFAIVAHGFRQGS